MRKDNHTYWRRYRRYNRYFDLRVDFNAAQAAPAEDEKTVGVML